MQRWISEYYRLQYNASQTGKSHRPVNQDRGGDIWQKGKNGTGLTVVSGQIAVYKTERALLELMDNSKPASYLFPAHIHASGGACQKVGERS